MVASICDNEPAKYQLAGLPMKHRLLAVNTHTTAIYNFKTIDLTFTLGVKHLPK